MAKSILTDTGFWLALCDLSDEFHTAAATWEDVLEGHQLVIPWPCLYETLNTRFVKHGGQARISHRLTRGLEKIDDRPYRDRALAELTREPRAVSQCSLTDLVIRAILQDSKVRIGYFITTDTKDFADLHGIRNIEIIYLEKRRP